MSILVIDTEIEVLTHLFAGCISETLVLDAFVVDAEQVIDEEDFSGTIDIIIFVYHEYWDYATVIEDRVVAWRKAYPEAPMILLSINPDIAPQPEKLQALEIQYFSARPTPRDTYRELVKQIREVMYK